jgi:Rod binding domain-containing protein
MDVGGLNLHTPNASDQLVDMRAKELRDRPAGVDDAEAAQKLEALFATLLVKELRKALPDGFFGKGVGADTFNGWFDQHVGEELADSGALRLAGMLKASIGSKQESQDQLQRSTDSRSEQNGEWK